MVPIVLRRAPIVSIWGGPSLKRKVSTELFWLSSLVAVAGSFKLCSLCFIRKLQAIALSIAIAEQLLLPGRLRLTVAVFGAALCPPWTALGVLQVGLVGSIWGCSTASFSRPCTKKTTRNNIEQAQEYNLTKHFGQCWCLKLRPVKVYELLDV